MFQFFINTVERLFPGSKPIIDNAFAVLKTEQSVIDAVLSAIKAYVPGTPFADFLTALQQTFDDIIANQGGSNG